MAHRLCGLLIRPALVLGVGVPAAGGAQESAFPPALHNETLAFDAARGRLVLVGGATTADGGRTFTFSDETWEWDGSSWSITAAAGAGPGARSGHGMGYDPEQRRIVLYGGGQPGAPGQRTTWLCDTWFYDGRSWGKAERSSCVSTRGGASLVWDSARRQMLLVEGASPVSAPRIPTRIWRWERSDWVLVDSSGPRRMAGDRVVFDEARSVVVAPVFVGADSGIWEWNGTRWERKHASGPGGRDEFALVYDRVRQRVVLAGGETGEGSSRALHDDLWSWDGARWTELTVSGSRPAPRFYATLLANPATGDLLYFGGSMRTALFRELWQFDRQGTWRLLSGQVERSGTP